MKVQKELTLTDDNIPEISALTGKTHYELHDELAKANIDGMTRTYRFLITSRIYSGPKTKG